LAFWTNFSFNMPVCHNLLQVDINIRQGIPPGFTFSGFEGNFPWNQMEKGGDA